MADVTGDGIAEVFHAGAGGVTAFDGVTGDTIWHVTDSLLTTDCQAQMADLNLDGIPEIVLTLDQPGGMLVLHGNNGSTYWRRTDLGDKHTASPVIADIDGLSTINAQHFQTL